MSIEIKDLVSRCCELIDENTTKRNRNKDLRKPARPVLVVFLGDHNEIGKKIFFDTLKVDWPWHYHEIKDNSLEFKTAEQFNLAMTQKDAEENTVFEKTVKNLCMNATLSSPNLLIVYILNCNSSDTTGFIDQLNTPYNTVIGGIIERVIFAIGKAENEVYIERIRQFMDEIKHTADNNRRIWNSTYCFVFSNMTHAGFLLNDSLSIQYKDYYYDNYAIAMSVILARYSEKDSVSPNSYQIPSLVRLIDEGGCFMTASLMYQKKPVEEISKTILYGYFEKCSELAENSADIQDDANDKLYAVVEKASMDLFNQLRANFPSEQSLRYLPNGAKYSSDVEPVDKKTFGIWEEFCRRYYIIPVIRQCEDHDRIFLHYSQTLSEGIPYKMMRKYSPKFRKYMADNRDNFLDPTRPAQQQSLSELGVYKAKLKFKDCIYNELIAVLERLEEEAKEYEEEINSLLEKAVPSDQSVLTGYKQDVSLFLEGIESELKRPCSEAELRGRLERYIEGITQENTFLLDFRAELKQRLEANEQDVWNAFINVSGHTLRDKARVKANTLNQLCKYYIYNPEATDTQKESVFRLVGGDSIILLAIYSFKGDDFTL